EFELGAGLAECRTGGAVAAVLAFIRSWDPVGGADRHCRGSWFLPALSCAQHLRRAARHAPLRLKGYAMLTALIVSQILSWVVILGMGLALVALARQVGVLHARLAPAGALMTGKGPAVGEPAPVLDAHTLDGAPVAIGKPLPAGRMQLLLFVSPHCPLCK